MPAAIGDGGELVIEVGLDILVPIAQPRQRERPQVDAREEILAEAPAATRVAEIAIRAGDQLEVARDLAIRAERKELLLLDRAKEHRLFVGAELADLVEKEHAAVGRAQQARADRRAAPVNEPRT